MLISLIVSVLLVAHSSDLCPSNFLFAELETLVFIANNLHFIQDNTDIAVQSIICMEAKLQYNK